MTLILVCCCVAVVVVVGIVLDIAYNGGPDNGADGWL